MGESNQEKTPIVSIYNEKPDLRKKEPPSIDLTVSNPVTYIKKWWKSVMGNEGIDFHFKIRPLTALMMTLVIASFGFGVGRITIQSSEPYIIYNPPIPTTTPTPFRETAFSGTLKYSDTSSRYFLLTNNSEAINLEVPNNIPLEKLKGKRIFATGRFYFETNLLVVSDAQDLEILPVSIVPVPTIAVPSPTTTEPVEIIDGE